MTLCEHHRGAWKRDADVAEAQGQGLGQTQRQGLATGLSSIIHENNITSNHTLTTNTTTTTSTSNPLVDALLTRFHGLDPVQVAELLDTTLVGTPLHPYTHLYRIYLPPSDMFTPHLYLTNM